MLSWNEIRHRAIKFSRDWKGTTSEKSERQTFWNELFDIFGIRRRTVAAFEEPVRKLSGNWGYIDLFWPSRVLVEHKSADIRWLPWAGTRPPGGPVGGGRSGNAALPNLTTGFPEVG